MVAQRAADVPGPREKVQIARHQAAETALALAREVVLDLALVRLERVEQHVRRGGRFLGQQPFPRFSVWAAASVRSGGQAASSAFCKCRRSWLTPRALIASISSRVRPVSSQLHQLGELLAVGRLAWPPIPTGGMLDPVLGTGAEQQRVVEALRREVAQQVLVGPHAGGARRAGSGPTC